MDLSLGFLFCSIDLYLGETFKSMMVLDSYLDLGWEAFGGSWFWALVSLKLQQLYFLWVYNSGVPSLWDLGLRWSCCNNNRNKMHNKYNALESSWNCCRKGDPFQGLKLGSCLTLGNELSEETHADKARDFIGKGHPGGEQEGKGTQENCSAVWPAVLRWWD